MFFSIGLDNFVMMWPHHYSTLYSTFIALKTLSVPPAYPSFPKPLPTTDLLDSTVCSLHSLAFSRMSYGWIQTVYSLSD